MKFKRIIAIAICFAFFICSGCNKINKPIQNNNPDSNKGSSINNPSNTPQSNEDESNNTLDSIEEQISKMSLLEKVGQLVIAGIDGYTNDEHSSELIEKYKVGGFILLGQNIKDANQALALINSLKSSNSKNKIPLFLGIDEEGGRITRMPAEFSKLPTNKAIGQKNNGDLSYNIGGILGEELTAFGLNLDFAPVLDINSNPQNPIIGDRSFGSKADLVSTLGISTMKGIQAKNIASAVKHFPGHGDTSVDSHIGLPVVNNDLNRLKSFELLPFSSAVKNGADMVMVAHILLPKIDKENPASFSKTIITDVLRDYLNYDGVVITDDMTMGAIVKNYNIGEAAVKSLLAGTDIILVCHDFDKETEVLNAITKAVENKVISEKSIDEKLTRVLKLKKKYNINSNEVSSVDVNGINKNINALLKANFK
ncbi:beta-N-acetylhexosaminidase [Candidatus Clostridium stratigraminis]|uniref:Beta-N-acetylhexosaminidase n=1 Tax=Candidatus Clostridium stratigraminis TaxID=3381661 RepID=A0ABW8T2E3_9CLOT